MIAPSPSRSAGASVWPAKNNLSQISTGQSVGIKEIAEKIWLGSFMHYDLGFFDHETGRVECA